MSDPERLALVQKKQDAMDKRRETQKADPSRVNEHKKTHAERMCSLDYRARASLTKNVAALCQHRPDNPESSPAERRQWERKFETALQAKGVTFSHAAIDKSWKRVEVELGLRPAGGRPPKPDLKFCAILIDVATAPATKWDGIGDAPPRFNVEVGKRLGGLDWDTARQRRKRHEQKEQHLPECPAQPRGVDGKPGRKLT